MLLDAVLGLGCAYACAGTSRYCDTGRAALPIATPPPYTDVAAADVAGLVAAVIVFTVPAVPDRDNRGIGGADASGTKVDAGIVKDCRGEGPVVEFAGDVSRK